MSDPAQQKVVVIGSGAAGVFTGYLLEKHAPGQFDITILEKNAAIGGNTRGHSETWEGETVHIDSGAQFFSESSEPEYCDMLREEGFFARNDLIRETAVGMMVWNQTTNELSFRVPNSLFGILESVVEDFLDWMNFLKLTEAAIVKFFQSWDEPFGTWLDRIEFHGTEQEKEAFKADIARPLMYQFGLVEPANLDELSAKFVIYYYVGSLPWPHSGTPPAGAHPEGHAPFHLYTCNIGMDGILTELVGKYGLKIKLDSRVQSVERQNDGSYLVKTADGVGYAANEVVYATNPQWTKGLLPQGQDSLSELLGGMHYLTVPVHVQRGPTSSYTTLDDKAWEVSNVTVATDTKGAATHYMLTVWFGPLKTQTIASQFFKSWGSPCLHPVHEAVFIEQIHELMVGTPDFMVRRDKLRSVHQGVDSLWFAGGYILDYDTQNTCLKSAADVAGAIIRKHASEPDLIGERLLPETRTTIEADQRPPLLEAIERELLHLDVDHPALQAFKTERG